jgi:hypothetical protein
MALYLFRAADRYKIGFSNDPKKRAVRLQTGCPFPIEVLAEIDADHDLELVLHQWFDRFRVCGEWFELPDAVIKWLKGATEQDVLRVQSCLILLSHDLSSVIAQSDMDRIRKKCFQFFGESFGNQTVTLN